jgi:hypothetical protein
LGIIQALSGQTNMRFFNRIGRHMMGEKLNLTANKQMLAALPGFLNLRTALMSESKNLTDGVYHHRLLFNKRLMQGFMRGLLDGRDDVLSWLSKALSLLFESDDYCMSRAASDTVRVACWSDDAIRVRCGYMLFALFTRIASSVLDCLPIDDSEVKATSKALQPLSAPAGFDAQVDECFSNAVFVGLRHMRDQQVATGAIVVDDDAADDDAADEDANGADFLSTPAGRQFFATFAESSYKSSKIACDAVKSLIGRRSLFWGVHGVACSLGGVSCGSMLVPN